jgi:hypothetical protein
MNANITRGLFCAFAALSIVAVTAPSARARVEAEALVGRPFGVGRIAISGEAVDMTQVRIAAADGRALYPAIGTGAVGRLIGQILGDPASRPAGSVNIFFLFRGDDPLEITVNLPREMKFTVRPTAGNPRQFDRLQTAWWREYSSVARQVRDASDRPPLLEDYLTTMLARRLNLAPPLLDRLRQENESSPLTTQSLELLLSMERLRSETMKATLRGETDFGQPLDAAIPAAPEWNPLPLPAADAAAVEVPIEPIAMRVPHECFYVRFGRFSNYLWMNKLTEEFGGDISSMVTMRSYIAPINQRVQRQLALEQSALGELLGDQVIADVAIIGLDTFTREGAAIGILFQARNAVLGNDLRNQQRRALAREKGNGATLETVQIGGRDVSFLSTPDNRVRSFYVSDGPFHLVTTSRAMVERFLAVGSGEGSLGNSAEFRYARQTMPLDRQDTIFVYFSAAFFEGLLTPQYQIELTRRMKSVTDIELLSLARLAAVGEGVSSDSFDELIAAGLLPPGFGRRPDGSGPVLADGQIIDSRRGARGAFLPIPDVELTAATEAEATRAAALSEAFAREWRQMDPLMIGIRRTALDNQRERIVIDGELAPLDESKYGWVLSMLGPPSREMVTPAAGDIVSMQMSARGGLLAPSVPSHYLFLGIQDMAPLGDLQPTGLLKTLQIIRTTPGYVGGWPKPGFLDLLPFNLGGSVPDENGFSRLPFGVWRRQGAGFSVLSFDPQMLASVTPQLRVVEAETEAQIRLHIGDLSEAKFKPWVQGLYYMRALDASAGNIRLLAALHQQLGVPLADCRTVAEDLLDAELHCPLGGEFKLVEEVGFAPVWQSTAWSGRSLAEIPADFEAPLLKWFRGVDAHLIKADGRIIARAEFDVQREPPQGGGFELPLFNLFGSGQKAVKPKEPLPPAEELPPPPLPPVPMIEFPREPAGDLEIPPPPPRPRAR